MSDFLTGLKEANNLTFTENGALTHRSTTSDLLDLFALGGAYRNRTDMDIIQLVNKAFCEDEVYTLKCLFYLQEEFLPEHINHPIYQRQESFLNYV